MKTQELIPSPRPSRWIAFGFIAFIAAGSQLLAQNIVTDDFSAGTVGQPPGNATGSNWLPNAATSSIQSSWTPTSLVTDTVANASPMENENQYLSYQVAGTSSAQNLGRQWNADPLNGGIDTSTSYETSFTLRIDQFNISSGSGLIRVYDMPSVGLTSSNVGWQFRLTATNGGLGDWFVYNFPGNGTANTPIDTGVAGVIGQVLDFNIICNPTQYELQIGENTNQTILYDSSTTYPAGLGYRTATPSTPRNALNFGSSMSAAAGDSLNYSIGNIVIAPVPEPSTYALCGLGALVLVIAVSRRKA